MAKHRRLWNTPPTKFYRRRDERRASPSSFWPCLRPAVVGTSFSKKNSEGNQFPSHQTWRSQGLQRDDDQIQSSHPDPRGQWPEPVGNCLGISYPHVEE